MSEVSKIRHFPHVDGQWVTHICLSIGVDKDSIVIPNGFQGVDQNYHISLCPMFSLQHFQIQGLLRDVEEIAMSAKRHVITFNGTKILRDSSNMNNFYVLLVNNDMFVNNLIANVKRVVKKYKPKYLENHDEEIVHMSVAISSETPTSDISHPPIMGITKSIECRIGGKTHEFGIKTK